MNSDESAKEVKIMKWQSNKLKRPVEELKKQDISGSLNNLLRTV